MARRTLKQMQSEAVAHPDRTVALAKALTTAMQIRRALVQT